MKNFILILCLTQCAIISSSQASDIMSADQLSRLESFRYSKKIQHQLYEAIRNGSVEQIREALSQGANVDGLTPSEPKEDYTPLMIAVMRENISIIKELLLHGADIDVRSPYLTGSVSSLATGRQANLIKGTLRQADQLNKLLKGIRNLTTETIGTDLSRAFMLASKLGFESIMDELLTRGELISYREGELIDYRDSEKNSALFYAIQNNNEETISYLKQHGATLTEREKGILRMKVRRESPFSEASRNMIK